MVETARPDPFELVSAEVTKHRSAPVRNMTDLDEFEEVYVRLA